MDKKNDVVKNVSANLVWGNNGTNRIEEQYMSPFIGNIIDEISAITGYELDIVDYEYPVGSFRSDIVCCDRNTNEIIVIENQLGTSDHQHLGKCLTYFSNLQANAVVWICEEFRPEHVKAIENLNEISSDEYNFYALELKFESYANNTPYYYFNKIVIPTLVSKLANNVRFQSRECLDVLMFLEDFIKDLQQDIPTAHFNKGRTYAKIAKKNDLYIGVKISPRTNDFSFEISTKNINDPGALAQLDTKIQNNLNSKYGYQFVYSEGVKNPDYKRWMHTLSNYDYANNVVNLKNICINIYKEI